MSAAAFWDASALIPLCVSQPQTASARALYLKHKIIAWWATEVEIRSGLTRLKRMAAASQLQFDTAKKTGSGSQ